MRRIIQEQKAGLVAAVQGATAAATTALQLDDWYAQKTGMIVVPPHANWGHRTRLIKRFRMQGSVWVTEVLWSHSCCEERAPLIRMGDYALKRPVVARFSSGRRGA